MSDQCIRLGRGRGRGAIVTVMSSPKGRANRPSEGEPFRPIQYTSDVFPIERVESGHSPTGKTHRKGHASGPQSRGRYHPRPEPRRRADVLGFNAMWWLIAILVVVLVLVLTY